MILKIKENEKSQYSVVLDDDGRVGYAYLLMAKALLLTSGFTIGAIRPWNLNGGAGRHRRRLRMRRNSVWKMISARLIRLTRSMSPGHGRML